ncbi:hypothetical protein E3N88_36743 [Mikania micrantha]|uniref:Transmembrane protein n=1 Tax=Mikania micrantha TaxID=192012 RepID=A0A5N6M7A8_9ASTR|nr:hypothetical protein E3N88_36743 [Mikania micrantha]
MDFSNVFMNVVVFIFVLLLAISSNSTSSPPSPPPVIKNQETTSSLFFSYAKEDGGRRRIMFTNMKKRRSETMTNSKNKVKFDWDDDRVFSAMLPKGDVPPSGSSSCHNDYPNSVASICTFSRHRPRKIKNDDP